VATSAFPLGKLQAKLGILKGVDRSDLPPREFHEYGVDQPIGSSCCTIELLPRRGGGKRRGCPTRFEDDIPCTVPNRLRRPDADLMQSCLYCHWLA